MDIINSVFTICSTVSQADYEYRVLGTKLQYQLQKAIHLSKSQKVKNVPSFLSKNLQNRIQQSKKHYQKIQKLLKQDSISLKQKIKLSLPFNKTNLQVKQSLQSLEKAQSDIQNFQNQPQPQVKNKRFINNNNTKYQKKYQKTQTKPDLSHNNSSKQQEVNDEDLDQFVMGPTVQQDVAIDFVKMKYITIDIQMKGDPQIIKIIKKKDPNLLKFKKKIQIKFEKSQSLVNQIQLFSLGRLYFKPVYKEIKQKYPDIDKVSKNSHFIIKLRRKKQCIQQILTSVINNSQTINNSLKSSLKSQQIKNQTNNQKNNFYSMQKKQINNHNDQFFSFPQTQMNIMKQIDTIIVQKAQQKNNVYLNDITGLWIKMQENEKQICKGQQIAPFIQTNREIPSPDIYFKVNYQLLQ